MGGRINTVMQPCFFALSGVLDRAGPRRHPGPIERTYAKAGPAVIERNLAAVDAALGRAARGAHSHRGDRPASLDRPGSRPLRRTSSSRVTARLLAGEGDLLPVSALPVDGAFPDGHRPLGEAGAGVRAAHLGPVAVHRLRQVRPGLPPRRHPDEGYAARGPGRARPTASGPRTSAPGTCPATASSSRWHPTTARAVASVFRPVPPTSKEQVKHKALNMAPAAEHREAERLAFDFFLELPELPPTALSPATGQGPQVREPLFEFSGACAGCGETPYLKLLTQLFGDRMVVANATGCSSIYGGNLPTTPWSTNADGPGPGLGQLAVRGQRRVRPRAAPGPRPARGRGPPPGRAPCRPTSATTWSRAAGGRPGRRRRRRSRPSGSAVADAAGAAWPDVEEPESRPPSGPGRRPGGPQRLDRGRRRLGLRHRLRRGRPRAVQRPQREPARARHRGVLQHRRPGLEGHATRRGGQVRLRRAVARRKKDLGDDGRAYGDVYVAQVAMGANDVQTVKALLEADAWPGPSLVIAYSPCVAHGIDMSQTMVHMRDAVHSGHWPLYRYQPRAPTSTSTRSSSTATSPDRSFREFAMTEGRFAMLTRSDPGAGRGPVRRGPSRRRRALALLRAAGRRRADDDHAGGGGGLVTDLTTYLPRACPCVRPSWPPPARSPATPGPCVALDAAGVGAVVLPSLFEEQMVHEALEVDRMLATGAEAFGEAAGYFPELDDLQHRARPLSGPGQPRRRRPCRSPSSPASTPSAAGAGCTTAGCWSTPGPTPWSSTPTWWPPTPAVPGGRVEDDLVTMVGEVRRRRRRARGGEARAVLVLAAGPGPVRLSEPVCRGAGPVQPALRPRPRPRAAGRVPHLTLSEPDDLHLPLRWIGSAGGPGRHRPGRHQRGPRRRRGGQGPPGGSPGGDDGHRPPPPRPRSRGRGPGRPAGVDGRERVRRRSTSSGARPLGPRRRRPRRLRPVQLPPGPHQLLLDLPHLRRRARIRA